MANNIKTPPFFNFSVEEENLAAIPFAVLERRVGKRVGKLEIKGTKRLADGTEVDVLWQVQGNNELGLPTEQDLDIFIALGVLTFRSNFSKAVSFTGRELAAILNIGTVHGKFYRRLKLAMDRFIPLRFRSLTADDRQQEVKWLNVFQEASFSLDRRTGRCVGTVIWTDKLIQSMDAGFFRVVDSGRYMELDGITAKHLYRYLAVAFERTDLLVLDARKLASEHLGILKLPGYMSRLMQTLEPALDQLIRIGVLGSYHVISNQQWRLALRRHPSYVPERKNLMMTAGYRPLDTNGESLQEALQASGFSEKAAAGYCEQCRTPLEFYHVRRAARLLDEMKAEEVSAHAALSVVKRALDAGVNTAEGLHMLDWCEIALEVCRYKKERGQVLKNLPGLLMKIAKDAEAQPRLVNEDLAESYRKHFREREAAALRQLEEEEERRLILEYEDSRRHLAESRLAQMSELERETLFKEKADLLRHQDRLEKIPPEARGQEIEQLALQEIARKNAPPFERWRLRRRAQQVVLPFTEAAGA